MKRLLAIALALVGVSAGAANESAVQADRALNAAFAKGDSAVVNKLLDADFTWIDTDGIMRERADALRAGYKPLVPNASDVKTLDHQNAGGKVVWVQTNKGTKGAGHTWGQRPAAARRIRTNQNATGHPHPV